MGCCCSEPASDDETALNQDQPSQSRRSHRSSQRSQLITTTRPRHHTTQLFHPEVASIASSRDSNSDHLKEAQRRHLIEFIPTTLYSEKLKNPEIVECAICYVDFEQGDVLKYLPCMHYYHKDCIDDWLVRSLTCPLCSEPVDGALISSFGPIS